MLSSSTTLKIKGENDTTENNKAGISSSLSPSDENNNNNIDANAITIDGEILRIEDVMKMKKEVENLRLVNDEKEKKYLEVSRCVV